MLLSWKVHQTYQRVIQLAIGCGFYAEASSFIRYAIELGELIDGRTYHLHNVPPSRPLPWQAWYLDLAESELKAGRVDDALQALDDGVARCDASDPTPCASNWTSRRSRSPSITEGARRPSSAACRSSTITTRSHPISCR